nr:60S acidic ribosomal protein P1 [Cryptomonas paramecium]
MWHISNKSEIGCILASLILSENNIDISEEKLREILVYAGIKFEKFWPKIFIYLTKNYNLSELFRDKEHLTKQKENINFTNEQQNISEHKASEKADSSCNKNSSNEDMGFGLFE